MNLNLALIALLVLLCIAVGVLLFRQGGINSKFNRQRKVERELEQAKKIIDRLDRDPEYRERVREHFTR